MLLTSNGMGEFANKNKTLETIALSTKNCKYKVLALSHKIFRKVIKIIMKHVFYFIFFLFTHSDDEIDPRASHNLSTLPLNYTLS